LYFTKEAYFIPEAGGIRFLLNTGNPLPYYTVSRARRQQCKQWTYFGQATLDK